MNYKTLLFSMSLIVLSGCGSIIKPSKIDVIAEEKTEKVYVLPKLKECKKPDFDILENGNLEEFYKFSFNILQNYKECDNINEEKNQWFKRNFKGN